MTGKLLMSIDVGTYGSKGVLVGRRLTSQAIGPRASVRRHHRCHFQDSQRRDYSARRPGNDVWDDHTKDALPAVVARKVFMSNIQTLYASHDALEEQVPVQAMYP
jgi:hypothetical protein